jgi:heme/copper-type cytochrome/quinol oxidase subunit 2
MAQEIQIPNAGSTAKIHNPIGVIALTLITLGIYGIFWWYFINREMADYGQANGVPELGDNPILSVLAITIGALIIVPPFVSLWRTLRRIETAQNRQLGSNNIGVVLLFVLIFIPLVNLVVHPLMQSNLNQVWESARA